MRLSSNERSWKIMSCDDSSVSFASVIKRFFLLCLISAVDCLRFWLLHSTVGVSQSQQRCREDKWSRRRRDETFIAKKLKPKIKSLNVEFYFKSRPRLIFNFFHLIHVAFAEIWLQCCLLLIKNANRKSFFQREIRKNSHVIKRRKRFRLEDLEILDWTKPRLALKVKTAFFPYANHVGE